MVNSIRCWLGLMVLLLLTTPCQAAEGAAASAASAGSHTAGSQPVNPLKDPIQLLDSLEKRRLELEERGRLLDAREVELKRMEERLGKRVAALETLRTSIESDLLEEKKLDDANIMRLAKIYSGMKTRAAAERMQKLDRKVALKVLKAMKEKVAAKVLGKMDAPAAVELADGLGITSTDRRNKR
ncbi:MAG: hypothetical protein HQL64_17105 [Magnetococcales bacterium]|nr:hypothetical protein [Magnetococcales bacterium]